jgi:hypothetical protein
LSRIAFGDPREQLRVEVAVVRQLGAVDRLEYAGLDLPAQELHRRHHQVIARAAGEQLGLEHFVAVEDVVGDLDAGLLFELRDGVLGDVIRPVVDEQVAAGLRLAGERRRSEQRQRKAGQQRDQPDTNLHGEPPVEVRAL